MNALQERSVAHIRAQIENECESLRHLFNRFSIVASHSMIEQKYQALHTCSKRLAVAIGPQEAIEVVNEIYAKKMG